MQGGIYQGSTVAFTFFPLALFGWGGVGAGAVVGFTGRVEGETRSQWVARGLRLPGALVLDLVDQDTTQEFPM